MQKYLESHRRPSRCCSHRRLARLCRFMLRSARRHPWLMAKATVTGNSVQMINTPARAREAFFSADAAEAASLAGHHGSRRRAHAPSSTRCLSIA